MFSSFSIGFGLPKLFSSNSQGVNIPSVEIHEIETSKDKRARTLKHLLKLNHANHAILFNSFRFQNHCPHVLTSAYLLGASSESLNRIYEVESSSLDPWKDSPGEISLHDWRDYLGKHEYQRAFIDFFEDQLVQQGYDWKAVVSTFLLSGPSPLINCIVAALGHPLIHLGFAFEINSREVAMEALGLSATCYNFLHKYLDDPAKYRSPNPQPPTHPQATPLSLFHKIHSDPRFDNLFETPGPENLDILFTKHEPLLLEYWNEWSISTPTTQFRDSQHAAVALLVASTPPPPSSHEHQTSGKKYDFFSLHLLSTSHAIRVLLPVLPAAHHIPLLRQWWLIASALYICALRPAIDTKLITEYDLQGRGWEFAGKEALEGKFRTDAHFVKGVRSMKEAEKTWGDKEEGQGFWLKAATKFAEGFDGWGGFGAADFKDMGLEGR